MVINTQEKNNSVLEYKELLVKLNSPELYNQGCQLLIQNRKKALQSSEQEKQVNFCTEYKNRTALVYDHSINDFCFINYSTHYSQERIQTTVGTIHTVTLFTHAARGFLKELEFPKNTLVVLVNTSTPIITTLKLDEDYAKTMIANTIKRANKVLEEQFVQTPLQGSIEKAFLDEKRNYWAFDKTVFVTLFPQFKTDEWKTLENSRLISFGISKFAHELASNGSIIDAVKKQTLTTGKSLFNLKHYNDSLQESLDKLAFDSLTEKELLELLAFLRKEFVSSAKFFIQNKNVYYYSGYYESVALWGGIELYYLVLKKVVETVNDKTELKTDTVLKELIELGAPLISKEYSSDRVSSLSFLLYGLIAQANNGSVKGSLTGNSECIETIEKELDCSNRAFFIEDFFITSLVDKSGIIANHSDDDSRLTTFVTELIKFFKTKNCSFITTEKTKLMIDSWLVLYNGIMNSIDNGVPKSEYSNSSFKKDSILFEFMSFLSEVITVVNDDSPNYAQYAFFYSE